VERRRLLELEMENVVAAVDWSTAAGEPEPVAVGDETWPAAAGAFRGSLALLRARQGAIDEARALLTRGEQQLRGVHALELGKLLCKRGEVERLAGDLDAARAARDEAASIAARIEAGPDSELGRALAALRDALNQ
jgi:hypothetical protein